ncbi:MAG: sensor histidine kinase, partial [Turicibacter sp.]
MTIILMCLLGFMVYKYLSIKKEIRYLTKQMKRHQKNYTNIRTHLLDQDVQELVVQINYLYDEKQAVNAARKNTQEQMSQNIANISHDLRTPLTSMIGYLQLLEDEKLSKEERMTYQDIIKSRTIALQNLIQDFYDLSLIQSKGYVFNYVAVDLNQVLCETLATYFHEFEIKKIEPHINLELSKAPLISDYQALTRIFSNLINNVLKHG